MHALDGQAAVVTGGSSGIGRAAALALARAGAAVAVVGRNAERVEETLALIRAERAGAACAGLLLDVASAADMDTLAATVLERFGRLDVLVAAAGRAGRAEARPGLSTVAATPLAEWQAIMDTNLRGVYLSNRAVLPHMMKQRSGTIVNVGSYPGSVRPNPLAAAYCASKHAVLGLTKSLAEEMRPHNIRVWALLPGPTDTPMIRNSRVLAAQGLLSAAAVAAFLVEAIALPADTILEDPIIAPFAGRGPTAP